MLKLKPACERCRRQLPPCSVEAYICTFECTFCRSCVETELAGTCPNCGGNLEKRPIRPVTMLMKYPSAG